ncbi:hypothetical protein IPT68_15100 [Streptomyces chromofuscus]|uniref:Uncharacterized protein n=1 Tax=Streptomyces chromofuscus TaxID=42881 RepID=A0A7M2TF19_STRCW|nr:hypothetical protein [Streptomyces chromofuscus]QOV47082.1 hypothetical protein IPT68_15100 [Streptomyces chromofuscus]
MEHHTDQLASAPWNLLGPEATARLAELLGDYWVTVIASGLLPSETTAGDRERLRKGLRTRTPAKASGRRPGVVVVTRVRVGRPDM